MHEAQITEENGKGSAFITLTYNEDSVPTDYGLNVRDLQLFHKKLRHRFGPFRYYAAGEYGPVNLRPHYHAILFGIDFKADRIPIGDNPRGDRRYLSPLLERTWGMGRTELGSVTPASAAYVAKYCVTRRTGEQADEIYRRTKHGHEWQVQPEFAIMSLKPGIGETWYRKYKNDVFPSDETIVDGKPVKTPKYYTTLLEREDPETHERIKLRRTQQGRQRRADNTPERLDAKELLLEIQEKAKHYNQ